MFIGPQRVSTIQISGIAMAVAVAWFAVGFVISAVTGQSLFLIGGSLAGLWFLFSIKVADQWDKFAVLRLGRYIGLRGPGLFFVVPLVDQLSRSVNQRVRTASVTAESTLTRDTVPVNVDAVVFCFIAKREKPPFLISGLKKAGPNSRHRRREAIFRRAGA
jgi:regulator of protease activity HflC (stomatin/prohibitin superfamily)